jgi:PIN domain nuclease of toxin-antitoxin system
MNRARNVLLDTHTLIWFLYGDDRLSEAALKAIRGTTAAGYQILVPSICLVKATYLVEKKRIGAEILTVSQGATMMDHSPLQFVDLTAEIALAVQRIPRELVPDLPDRVIAGTALALGVLLVSRDRKIGASEVETIW